MLCTFDLCDWQRRMPVALNKAGERVAFKDCMLGSHGIKAMELLENELIIM